MTDPEKAEFPDDPERFFHRNNVMENQGGLGALAFYVSLTICVLLSLVLRVFFNLES